MKSDASKATTALALSDLADDRSAEQVFRLALGGEPARAREAQALIRRHPQAALARLQDGRTGLSPYGEHGILEEATSDLSPDDARRHMEVLSSERLAEIIAASGDRPSTAGERAPFQTVIAAMLNDVGETRTGDRTLVSDALFTLLTWAEKLKDREDYEEILDFNVGDIPIRDWLYLSVLLDQIHEGDEEYERIAFGENRGPMDPDEFLEDPMEFHYRLEAIGLVHDTDTTERVRALIAAHDMPTLDDLERARRELTQKREEEQATLFDQSRASAGSTADALEI